MKLEFEVYDALCETKIFKINGIDADYEDFGDKEDMLRAGAPEYGCGNMRFSPKLPTQEILGKYKITVDEYDEVCDKLETCLSFGYCAWCS